MYLAHLPAGYLLTSFIQTKSKNNQYLKLGLVASVAPDFDMIYKILFDSNGYNHRYYITHLPLFWVGLTIISYLTILALFKVKKINLSQKNNYLYMLLIFMSNVFLHLALDLPTGLLLLRPFSDHIFRFVIIANNYNNYLLNIIFTHYFW